MAENGARKAAGGENGTVGSETPAGVASRLPGGAVAPAAWGAGAKGGASVTSIALAGEGWGGASVSSPSQ